MFGWREVSGKFPFVILTAVVKGLSSRAPKSTDLLFEYFRCIFWSSIGKETLDLGGILQKHEYWHSSAEWAADGVMEPQTSTRKAIVTPDHTIFGRAISVDLKYIQPIVNVCLVKYRILIAICAQSQNRSWEVLNMFKNLAETDFASTIVHYL